MTDKPAYNVKEIGVRMAMSRNMVTRLFEREPGVIMVTRPSTKGKRRYRSMRIPHAVYVRVLERLSL